MSSASPATDPDMQARPKTSLTMIVQNDEKLLTSCLDSVSDLMNEAVIVNIGSSDGTKEIALRYGAKVVDVAWEDSFAAARNVGLKNATGAWVFCMDANERLDEANRAKLNDLLAHLPDENTAFSVKCRHLPTEEQPTATVVDQIRLFRIIRPSRGVIAFLSRSCRPFGA